MMDWTDRHCRVFHRVLTRSAVLYTEMVTARAFVEGNDKTQRLISFDADESPRSLQFYTVDPGTLAQAVRRVVADDLAEWAGRRRGVEVYVEPKTAVTETSVVLVALLGIIPLAVISSASMPSWLT